MQGQIIDPKKVQEMICSGELAFGMELEFSNCFGDETYLVAFGIFDGFWNRKEKPFHCISEKISECGWYQQARSPLPDLWDGDPVIIIGMSGSEHPAYLKKQSENNKGIMFYGCGHSNWTSKKGGSIYAPKWRLPTKKELSEAGMAGWYDGRRGIILKEE